MFVCPSNIRYLCGSFPLPICFGHITLYTLIQNLETALKRFDTTLATNGSDPVALYGRAKALDALAAQRKDNRLLRQSIAACERLIMQLGIHLSDHVFRATAERCVEQMRFIGKH